jgi:hypothetical protein
LNFVDSYLWIIRDNTTLSKEGEDRVLFKRLLLNTMDCCKEFELVEVATTCTSSVINGFGVEVLERLEKHNVKWLEDMASMRRQNEHMDKPLLTEFEDFSCYMTSTAITK